MYKYSNGCFIIIILYIIKLLFDFITYLDFCWFMKYSNICFVLNLNIEIIYFKNYIYSRLISNIIDWYKYNNNKEF